MTEAEGQPERDKVHVPPLDPQVEQQFGLKEGQSAWLEHLRYAEKPAPALGTLGPYELIAELGRGGQGSVYKARQPGTDRVVALKRLMGDLSDGLEGQRRFRQEVEALTRLSHRNIVTVYAVEVIDGRPVLVMEFVEGPTIDRWSDAAWASGLAPLRTILEAFAQVCDGVAHGHQRGVIHRDIKPGNVLVDETGTPRVVDFGIARVRALKHPGASAWVTVGFAGTPAYAAPEQIAESAEGVDTRSDVYSLGVLLYRVVTGREAFGAGEGLPGIAAAFQARAAGVPRPRCARPSLPRELDWIVARATATDPGDRYQTAEAIADDIRRVLAHEPVTARRAGAGYVAARFIRRHPVGVGLGALGVGLFAAVGAVAVVQALHLSSRNEELAVALRSAEDSTRRANQEQARAEREGKAQRDTSSMLLKAIANATPDPGLTKPRPDPAMERTLRSLLTNPVARETPNVELELRLYHAITQRGSGNDAEALGELRRALALSLELDGPRSERRARITQQLSLVLSALGRAEEAVTLCREAIDRAGPEKPDATTSAYWLTLAITLAAAERSPDEVVQAGEVAIDHLARFASPARPRYRTREELAKVAASLGMHERAVVWAREAISILDNERSDPAARSQLQLIAADSLLTLGRSDEAEVLARDASEYHFTREGAGSADSHRALCVHAEALHRLGRFAEAAARWDLALRRPMGLPHGEAFLPPLLVRLAAARFGAHQEFAGRLALARALSPSSPADVPDPALAAKMERVEAALKAGGWQIDDGLRERLGELGKLVGPMTGPPSRDED